MMGYHECTLDIEPANVSATNPDGLTTCGDDDVEGEAASDDYVGCCDGGVVYYVNGGGVVAKYDCADDL